MPRLTAQTRYETREVGRRVRDFYEGCSFPGYEDLQTPADLVQRANRGIYARLLDEQLPLGPGVRILDAGCGTGQLAIFLSMARRKVIGIDFSFNSLLKANRFRDQYNLNSVHFAEMDLFSPGLCEESFDYVFCNGVLHHTADAYGAFQNLCRLVNPGGYIAIGLYNTYGRLFTNLRRWIFRITNDRFTRLDYFMRKRSIGDEKRRIWFQDQYKNPHDTTWTVGEVLRWFRLNGFAYVNSIPSIRLGEPSALGSGLFDSQQLSNAFERWVCQISWIFSTGREGGFFLTIGRKTQGLPA
jgi:SAM-dependent methyltransferase